METGIILLTGLISNRLLHPTKASNNGNIKMEYNNFLIITRF
jgi:hypothetical protein